MEKSIKKLKAKYGTYRELALFLEITERRLMQVLASGKAGMESYAAFSNAIITNLASGMGGIEQYAEAQKIWHKVSQPPHACREEYESCLEVVRAESYRVIAAPV